MHLHNNSRIISLFIVFSVLTVFCISSKAIAKLTMEFVKIDYQKLVSYLGTDQNEGINDLLSRWADYVKDITKFSNNDYLAAIHSLQNDYYNEISKYEDIIKIEKADRKKHSSAWLDNLIDHFGKAYVVKNKNAIIANIQLLLCKRHDFYFKGVSEKLIYKEAELYGVYRKYFDMFKDYYKTLKPEDQKMLKSRKEAVDSFLSSLNDHSITQILTANSDPSLLLLAKRTENLNKKLYMYFKEPSFLPNFDPMKAVADLQKITNQMQSKDK